VAITECAVRKEFNENFELELSVCSTASRLYFVDKVASVRRSAGGSEASTVLPPTTARLDQLVVCSAEDIYRKSS